MQKNKKVGIISLGCDKNRVDTEKMIALIKQQHKIVNDIEKAQIIIINTCAFLKSARQEAISEVLSAYSLKENGVLEKIIVTGCLPQKYSNQIFNELKEVDAFLGVADYSNINEVIDQIYLEKRVNCVHHLVENLVNENLVDRSLSTNGYAYLKIADGCYNRCTFCAIPSIRGNYRSVEFNKLIEEAKALGKVKELILVAQDTTRYGSDLTPKTTLAKLVEELSKLENIGSIRLLYCYPEAVTEELINQIKNNPKVVKYIDIPLQHGDDRILKLMGRRGDSKYYLSLIKRLKKEIKGIAIRSTFMVGFPTEDQKAFDNLIKFIQKAKLFHAGFFKYSREEGTPAYKLKGQVLAKEKNKRLKAVYKTQQAVAQNNLKKFMGKTLLIMAEGFDQDRLVYYGRAYFSAPDIDGKVYFFSDDEITYGESYKVKITDLLDYDLIGERL